LAEIRPRMNPPTSIAADPLLQEARSKHPHLCIKIRTIVWTLKKQYSKYQILLNYWAVINFTAYPNQIHSKQGGERTTQEVRYTLSQSVWVSRLQYVVAVFRPKSIIILSICR